MPDPIQSLYDVGWRQGSLIEAYLPCDCVAVEAGVIVRRNGEHNRWVLVTQDCDLDSMLIDSQAFVELRPLLDETGYVRVGIRSEKFALADGKILRAQSARTMIEARSLHALIDMRQPPIESKRLKYLKTWLGLRYDRPAVPKEYVKLAKAVAEAVKKLQDVDVDCLVRCVLMDLRVNDGPTANLYAVIYDANDRDVAEQWLEKVGAMIGADAGRILDKQAITEKQVSLQVIENTYAADLSQITVDAESE